ncbi:MAG: hypothetical protein R3E97_08730 [Candidatus Eisenbacteria bacterium]
MASTASRSAGSASRHSLQHRRPRHGRRRNGARRRAGRARSGRKFFVHVDGTCRPLLQGARLNSWELRRAGVPYTVQCDGAAAFALARFSFDAALVGADRIAANGDTANKIGTYERFRREPHGVPFYVVAPRSSFDLSIATGAEIPIEERNADEVRAFRNAAATPPDAPVYNPAFDVTPAHLIAGWVTGGAWSDRHSLRDRRWLHDQVACMTKDRPMTGVTP